MVQEQPDDREVVAGHGVVEGPEEKATVNATRRLEGRPPDTEPDECVEETLKV